MIHKVRLKNFKRIEDEIFELTDFDLLVGANNSGKSTLLQALAIWQYCVDQFRRSKRRGNSGIQIVLPNFTALPLPEFVLLWKDKTERRYPEIDGKRRQEFILVEIEVFWMDELNDEKSLNVQLRYQSPQSVYAIPGKGWTNFKSLEGAVGFPKIVYVPPFSGLEPNEIWYDDANVRKNVGKAQPGSVLRNLLYRIVDNDIDIKNNQDWNEIYSRIMEWFGVSLNSPQYEKGESIDIELTFNSNGKDFDIISGGSGFHQILTLFAFFYGYPGITTILFDEPDAHLHVNLQKKILGYFKQQKKVQFLIATHAEEFIKGVEVNSIISMLSGKPKRVQATESVVKAMSDVDNMVVIKTKQSPYIIYLEGEDDERLISAWALTLGKSELLAKFYIQTLGGSTKEEMKKRADTHFNALKQIHGNVRRIVLFDFDSEISFHPQPDNPVIKEWKRKNIENYLLVPDAWKKAVLDVLNCSEFDLYNSFYQEIIDDFFNEQGLLLPKGFSWSNVKANIFQAVDGKRILFENSDSLFQRLKAKTNLTVNREKVSTNMDINMIHNDIVSLFHDLSSIVD
ncbi:MAG: AAA family ATPase [Bacteroidota bacterium]|nr:AAA family ATPase [Bacteroidota bacterium]